MPSLVVLNIIKIVANVKPYGGKFISGVRVCFDVLSGRNEFLLRDIPMNASMQQKLQFSWQPSNKEPLPSIAKIYRIRFKIYEQDRQLTIHSPHNGYVPRALFPSNGKINIELKVLVPEARKYQIKLVPSRKGANLPSKLSMHAKLENESKVRPLTAGKSLQSSVFFALDLDGMSYAKACAHKAKIFFTVKSGDQIVLNTEGQVIDALPTQLELLIDEIERPRTQVTATVIPWGGIPWGGKLAPIVNVLFDVLDANNTKLFRDVQMRRCGPLSPKFTKELPDDPFPDSSKITKLKFKVFVGSKNELTFHSPKDGLFTLSKHPLNEIFCLYVIVRHQYQVKLVPSIENALLTPGLSMFAKLENGKKERPFRAGPYSRREANFTLDLNGADFAKGCADRTGINFIVRRENGDKIAQSADFLFDNVPEPLKISVKGPSTEFPVLLLPLRLETRFYGKTKLRVRIYPDQIFVDTHEEGISRSEYDSIIVYRKRSLENKRNAWRSLSAQFGPARAAWLVTWAAAHDFEASMPDFNTAIQNTGPKLAALPDYFAVFIYRDNSLGVPVFTKFTEPVRKDSTLIATANTDASDATKGIFDERSKWMVDFDQALIDGFAVEIPISENEDHFDRIVAVGLQCSKPDEGRRGLEGLLRSHRFCSGLGFIAPGTPTNNTTDGHSALSSQEDHDSAYEIEVEGPTNWDIQEQGEQRTNAHRLACALGIDAEVLRYTAGAGNIGDSFAYEVNTIIWPATGDYYFRHLLPNALDDQQLAYLASHQREFVRGGGPLPSIRIGRQPYGILPVTRIQPLDSSGGWAPWQNGDQPGTSSHDEALHAVIMQLYKRWQEYANNCDRVPRVVSDDDDDPDATLLQILSMEPRSVTYYARTFADEPFVGLLLVALRKHVFGSGTVYAQLGMTPVQAMAQWSETRHKFQKRTARLLKELSDGSLDEDNCLSQPLLNMFAWPGKNEPAGMTLDPNNPDQHPTAYLKELIKHPPSIANTLLAKMVNQSLQVAMPDSARDTVHDAVHRLTTLNVLDFFNSVSDAQQIVKRVKDDPMVHPERKGYGVRLRLAKRILERRDQLGGFESVQQIDDVWGVGPDTLHDIVYSFQDIEGDLDIDRLFRESLDLASYRVDAWLTSFATKRLKSMRTKESIQQGLHIGAYGFVENLCQRTDTLSEGYLHAPSGAQSAAAAVLYNAFLTHDPKLTQDKGENRENNPFLINLTSGRVRGALRVLEGIRQGQPIGALLGYQFERALKDNKLKLSQYIDDLREIFPIVAHKLTEKSDAQPAEKVAARNVVDGAALVRDYRERNSKNQCKLSGFFDDTEKINDENHETELKRLLKITESTMDAVGDLLMNESIYQAVQGNYERAGAALEAASGNQAPSKLESIATPVSGRTFTHRVCTLFNNELLFNNEKAMSKDPRGVAEPRVAKWFADLLGPMEKIGVEVRFSESSENSMVSGVLGLNELGGSAADFLYDAQATPEGGETDLERRVARLVRKKYSLAATHKIEVFADLHNGFSRSLADAVELAQQALKLLASGRPMSPDTMCHPGDVAQDGFEELDVSALEARVAAAQKWVFNCSKKLSEGHDVVEILLEATRFGVPGAEPYGDDDPDLDSRLNNAQVELTHRLETSKKLVAEATTVEDNNARIKTLLAAMKAIFGQSFVVIPTFVPKQASDLGQAFNQDIDILLGGQGENRLRLWMQQVAEVRQPLAELEDTLMYSDAWSQSIISETASIFTLKLAQLPFTEGRFWIGLSDVERKAETSSPDWVRSPLSLVVVSNGPMPNFADDSRDDSRVITAGLLLDEWSEVIPNKEVNTSVAFQYDGPNTQAPQSLLLAVPGEMKEPPSEWTHAELAQIVNDTIDLSKVRAVDIDALAEDKHSQNGEIPDPIGSIMPGIYLPADLNKPIIPMNTIDEWIEELLAPISFYMFDTKLSAGNSAKWEHKYSKIWFIPGVEDKIYRGKFEDKSPEFERTVLYPSGNFMLIMLSHDVPRIDIVMGWLVSGFS